MQCKLQINYHSTSPTQPVNTLFRTVITDNRLSLSRELSNFDRNKSFPTWNRLHLKIVMVKTSHITCPKCNCKFSSPSLKVVDHYINHIRTSSPNSPCRNIVAESKVLTYYCNSVDIAIPER